MHQAGQIGIGPAAVRFGATTPANVNRPVSPMFAGTDEKKEPEKAKPVGKSPRQYGKFENNMREAVRLLTADVLPLALGFTMFGGLPGIILAIAGAPIAFVSGKIGRRIGKDVDQNNLIGIFKFIATIRETLGNTLKTQTQSLYDKKIKEAGVNADKAKILKEIQEEVDVTDNINQATLDFLGASKIPFKAFLTEKLILKQGSKMAKILNNAALLRAGVYSKIAQSDSVAQAAKEGVKGGFSWALYMKILPRIGDAIISFSKIGWVPFKGLIKTAGEGLKRSFEIKLAIDGLEMLFPKGKGEPPVSEKPA